MVGVEMGKENASDGRKGDVQLGQALGGASANVEDELQASSLHEDAGAEPFKARTRCARAE
jgi:hypothetical protein